MNMWDNAGCGAGAAVVWDRGALSLTSRRTRRPCRQRQRSPVSPHVRICRVRSPRPPGRLPAEVVMPLMPDRCAGVDIQTKTVGGLGVAPSGAGGLGPSESPLGADDRCWAHARR
jgi:hypothetical protein